MSCRPCKIEAYAKINLTLEVYGKRPDGYHDLRSVVLPVSLCDTLEISESGTLSSDSGFTDDLALKAARLLAPGRTARIAIAKRIPVGGGLGGGSADAAAALIGLNRFWKLGRSREELMAIAAQVGSDVPALVYGAPCIMEGRGERILPLPESLAMQLPNPALLVLANPGVQCSTREVYENCTPRLDFSAEKEYNIRPINDLEAPAIRLHPQIGALKELMGQGACMSGSGSTVFKFVKSQAEGLAMRDDLRTRGYWAEIAHTIVR